MCSVQEERTKDYYRSLMNVKNIFVKIISIVLCLLLVFMVTPKRVFATGSLLQQINEAEKQKQETEKQKQEAEKEKAGKNDEINKLKLEQGTLKQQLDEFNTQLADENAKYEEIQSDIVDKNAEIEETKKELEEAKETEKAQYEAMKKRVQSIYEQPDNAYLEMVLSADSFASFLNLSDYIKMISEYDNKMYEDYKNATIAVADKEKELEGELSDLKELEEQSEQEQARINELITTTNDFVKEYTVQIGTANQELAQIEKEIAEKEAAIAAQEADIEALKKKYEEELRMSRLAANSSKRDISEVHFSDSDRVLLANLIYCEAGGEPYEGQLAVGAVVINRVLSSCYPDTINDVIYQRSQFSPAGSGRLALALAQNKATPSCYQAADEAMAGMTNVGNCVYFRTPIPGLTGIQIGNHIFY